MAHEPLFAGGVWKQLIRGNFYYPVLAFKLGAQAQRLEKYDCGWTLEDLPVIYDFLRCIVTPHGRREIQAKAAHTERFVNGAD